MKKAFLAYQYSFDNAGDFAITLGALDCLSNMYEEVIVLSKLAQSDNSFNECERIIKERYSNVTLVGNPFHLSRSSKIKTIFSYAQSAIAYINPMTARKIRKLVAGCDCVYLNGGNLLRCNNITDRIRLIALLFPAKIALVENKPFVFLPASTTDIKQPEVLSEYLNKAETVFTRESLSERKLKKLFPLASIVNAIDMAFFINGNNIVNTIPDEMILDIEGYYCITIRKNELGDVEEFDEKTTKIIRDAIVELVDNLIGRGKQVVFVIQTKKDKRITKEVFSLFESSEDVYLIESYNPLFLMQIYKKSSCLIGMRLHSLILAMSSGTPVVGFFHDSWGLKNPGILTDLQMPYIMIGDDVDLDGKIEESLQSKNRMKDIVKAKKKELLFILQEKAG